VPFLQLVNPEVKIVPLVLGAARFEPLEELGSSLAQIIKDRGKPVLVVASSDMTHYEPDASARQKDNLAIKEVLELDPGGLWDVVHQNNISMCGYAPVTAMLVCAKQLGAREGKLVKYQTSGDVTGDRSAVVGYAGLVVV
jgi:AmmeMemoRadiSam system protein B